MNPIQIILLIMTGLSLLYILLYLLVLIRPRKAPRQSPSRAASFAEDTLRPGRPDLNTTVTGSRTRHTYQESDGIALTFTPAALEVIVGKAVEYKLGARGLRSIVESVMMDAMFEIPSKKVKKFEVTADYAREKLEKSHLQKLAS